MLGNRDTRGQGLVEYALIVVAIAVAVVLALSVLGFSVREVYCQVAAGLGDDGVCGAPSACTFAFDEASDLDSWQGDSKEDLSIEDGRACITGNGSNARSYFNTPCSSSLRSDDISITLDDVTVDRQVQNNNNTGLDVWFRAQDDRNGYLFIYNAKGDYVRFWKIVDGRWIQLSHANVPRSWRDQTFDLQIDVQGDTFTAYKDGEAVLQATDSAYTSGQVGLRNKPSSKSCVGDMAVDDLP